MESFIQRAIETGMFGDWTVYIVGIFVLIYIGKIVGSPFKNIFEGLARKEDIKSINEDIEEIRKSISRIEGNIDNNLDILKTKIDSGTTKVQELENISKNNKLGLESDMRELQYIRNALDNMAISMKMRPEK